MDVVGLQVVVGDCFERCGVELVFGVWDFYVVECG